jgi:hypothetical protein
VRGLQSRGVTVRKLLLRVPVLGGWVERRWMPDPVERDAHREIVRERLDAPIAPPILAPMRADEPPPSPLAEPTREG